MILIRNGEVFCPAAMGRCDILTNGRQILAVEKSIQPGLLPGEVEVIDVGRASSTGINISTAAAVKGVFTPALPRCSSA